MTLKIALVNDYEIVVRGLADMLRSYQHLIEVVELNANSTVRTPVDIALFDTFAANQGDLDDVRTLARNAEVNKVVIYTWNYSPEHARQAMSRGASGFLSKGMPASHLVRSLQAIGAGRAVVSTPEGGIGESRMKVIGGDWPGREEGLTVRESEVLALITQGLSNVEVADRARLSINSVKSYIRSCYRKIGVTTRSQAILWGLEHGFRPDFVRVQDPDIPGRKA